MKRPYTAPLQSEHECKACVVRAGSGQSGLCPACANDRTRAEFAAERREVVMSSFLNNWYSRFRSEMEAIGCVFDDRSSLFGDEDIKVPLDKQDEAMAIIKRYAAHPQMKNYNQ